MERISWLLKTVQQSLAPSFDGCLAAQATAQEEHQVRILELIQI